MKTNMLRIFAMTVLVFLPVKSQLPFDFEVLKSVKNVVGGILAVDNVHRKCFQKTLCEQFSDEVVNMVPSRSVNRDGRRIWVPKVVRKRGRLRFLGDIIFKGFDIFLQNTALRYQKKFRRRQLGPSLITGGNAVTRTIGFMGSMVQQIPAASIVSLMDFAADATNVMNRRGAVYPYFRAATVGYGYGNRRDDGFNGVCSQIAEDCNGWWDHLNVINEYDGGKLPRINHDRTNSFTRSGEGVVNGDDPLTWNNIKVEDISSPKIFLCKASKFLEKLSDKMGGDEVVKERFADEDFQATCIPEYSSQENVIQSEALVNVDSAVILDDDKTDFDSGEDLPLSEIEILELRSSKSFEDLPILVFEGLPEPRVDETEIEGVERLLNSSLSLPSSSVRNAIRLPIKNRGRDIVLVEMDTEDHEILVLRKKTNVRKSGGQNLGIRRAKYKELWQYVGDLLAVRNMIDSSDVSEYEDVEVIEARNSL